MKRTSGVDTVDDDTTSVFIPDDIWFIIIQAIPTIRDKLPLKQVSLFFRAVVERQVKRLESTTTFDAMRITHRIPQGANRHMFVSLSFIDMKQEMAPFEKILVAYVKSFLAKETILTLSLWGDNYRLYTQESRGNAGKYCIYHKNNAKPDTCYCENALSQITILKNIIKSQLVKGLGCQTRMDIYTLIPTVELFIHLFDNFKCAHCYSALQHEPGSQYKRYGVIWEDAFIPRR